MRHDVSRDLHAYWDTRRAGRGVPERSDIDPTAIRHLLAHTFILDAGDDGRGRLSNLRFRLSGTRLDALFRHDLRGTRFQDLWAPQGAASAEAAVDSVLGDRRAVVGSACGAPPGRLALDLELLLLPLRHRGETGTRILGSLASFGTPSWMGLSFAPALELEAIRCLPDRAGPGRLQSLVLPVAEGPPPPTRQIGRFTVYSGGRSAVPSVTLQP